MDVVGLVGSQADYLGDNRDRDTRKVQSRDRVEGRLRL